MATLKGDGKAIIGAFIISLIAITILIASSNQIWTETNSRQETNRTVTVPAAVNSSVELQGRELITKIELYNSSNKALIPPGVELRTRQGSDGLLSVFLTTNDTTTTYLGQSVNVSYTYLPDGYATGAVGIVSLILIVGSLAVLVCVLFYFFKDGSLGNFIRRS